MNEGKLRVRKSREIKLKDVPINRSYIIVDFSRDFGFVPEKLIIEKVKGSNNKILICPVLTKEEEEKEDQKLALLDEIRKGKN